MTGDPPRAATGARIRASAALPGFCEECDLDCNKAALREG